jgi:hypothetical protein
MALGHADIGADTSTPERFREYTDHAGAAELKTRIEAYWRVRGFEVQVMLVDAPFSPALRAVRVDVRSELLNGLPPAKRRSVA